MRFLTVQVLNYKSFRDSGEITLTTGFNVIVGKNDAGKSALLEALSLRAGNKPHRSLLTAPTPQSVLDPESVTKFSTEIECEEFSAALSTQQQFSIPWDGQGDGSHVFARFEASLQNANIYWGEWINGGFRSGFLKDFSEFDNLTYFGVVKNIGYPVQLKLKFEGGRTGGPDNTIYSRFIGQAFVDSIYTFRAERLNVGEHVARDISLLESNASNLAEVINNLMYNPHRFERFLGHVKSVFPSIKLVTAPITNGTNTAKIMIWGVSRETERADLAVPLAESGTGVGQVLAMLYVVVTADTPKVIIIDEPQSFLHPGAARKLLEILRGYPQHQYIITTHAPTAIAATDAETLIRVSRVEHESVVENISTSNENALRLFLADIGASLSDVFGADSVLWVEGKTEELCFPVIIKKLNETPLLGRQILGVQSTADLEGKLASRVFEVYNRLTTSSTLLPPAIAFILDKEGKSPAEINDVNEKSKGQVRWLPRRMYENYLLHPASIARAINDDDPEREAHVTGAEIETWISENARNTKYFDRNVVIPEHPSDAWEETVHAANFLQDMFGALTEYRVSYEKVRHGLKLTEWLVKEPTDAISQLGTFLKTVFDQQPH